MAGRIRDEDVVSVRERARIDEVVGEYVQLKPAGGGSLKGLCPFHDEKSPSFNVNPSKGYYHCFGCAEGGDVFTFLQKVDHLTFAESVERLAGRYNVQLRYEEGGSAAGRDRAPKTRFVEANRAAQLYFAEQLTALPEAQLGRAFLEERGFDRAAAERFGVGYAPKGWDGLNKHLRGKGYSDAELLSAGLLSQGQRGVYDRFRGRLIWPIHSAAGDVIGFGARRLHDDDDGPKYLNTPETPIYKKSEVLFGIELAKKEIAKRQQAVVVEGYTDVMACHVAGVETAVATCGTSFGEDHVRILRRLLMDQDEFRGEVVFTFDGDEAGQKAAVRAFTEDRKFVTQLFVAVEPSGLDPCELWQTRGPEAVRELVARRVPLSEFVVKGILAKYDLNVPEGRIAALRAAAPVVARTKDRSLAHAYAVSLSGWLGMEPGPVLEVVAQAARAGSRGTQVQAQTARGTFTAFDATVTSVDGVPAPVPVIPRPRADDRDLMIDREALKASLQYPVLAGPTFDELGSEAFGHPAYVAVKKAIEAAGGVGKAADLPATGGDGWVRQVLDAASNDAVRSIVTELSVEPLHASGEPDARYCEAQVGKIAERAVALQVIDLKSRLQRIDPTDADQYNQVFGDLIVLEQRRRQLRDQAIGGA